MIGARAMTLSRELTRELAQTSGAPVVTSLYLDVDGESAPRASDLAPKIEHLARLARQLGESRGPDIRRAVEADLERITARLGQGLDRRHVRGFAAFSSSPVDLFVTVEIPLGFEDAVSVDRRPHIAQLLVALDSLEPILVVMADKERARLIRVQGRTVTEHPGPFDLPERQADTGVEIGSFERRQQEATEAHLRNVANAVATEARHQEPEHIVLGGQSADQLRTLLFDPDARRLAGTIPVATIASTEEVAAAATALVATTRRHHADDLVELLRSRVGIGTVLGLGATLDSLAERRVATLVVGRPFEEGGVRCRSCGLLALGGDRCERCGQQTEPVADLFEEIIGTAVASGAKVTFATSEALEAAGGIGALERY